MIIFKNTAGTMEGVLRNQKHATSNNLQFQPGEIILIQQTVGSLASPKQKTIRWIMNYVETYPDVNNESDAIWGRHWNYIIRGENVRPVEGFNISDLQVTNHNYGPAVTHAHVQPLDEIEVLNWIGEINPIQNEENDLAIEFGPNGARNINEIIDQLNQQYAGQPTYRTTISRSINRPTALRNAIIERDGTTCKICQVEGFIKRTGERYCELHHMVELNNQAPNTLQSWNLLVLCPTCHKQIHHGNVVSEFLNPGWRITIDGQEHLILN